MWKLLVNNRIKFERDRIEIQVLLTSDLEKFSVYLHRIQIHSQSSTTTIYRNIKYRPVGSHSNITERSSAQLQESNEKA